jgi:hypothetical protein
MKNLSGHTATELLKMSNDIATRHEHLKREVIELTFESDLLEKKINEKLLEIEELEKNYVELMEEMSKR